MDDSAKIKEAIRLHEAEIKGLREEAKKRGIDLTESDEGPAGQSGQEALDALLGVLDGPPIKPLIKLATFPDYELGPGMVSVLGSPPASGKTTLAMQMVFEAIEYADDLLVYVLNCEMTPEALLRRELCRLAGVNSKSLRFNTLDESKRGAVKSKAAELRQRLERVRFVSADAEGLARVATAKPGIVLIDYLQRFTIGKENDPRQMMNAVMNHMRRLAGLGHSVLAISATKRSEKGKHSNGELSLSSFRESGEIEYGADSCYVLKTEPASGSPYRPALLQCVKNRHGEPISLDLVFDTSAMSFEPAAEVNEFMQAMREQDQDDDNPFGGAA